MKHNNIKIFRVILEVSNSEQAIAFYKELFNIQGRNVGGGRYYFDCGSVILALLEQEKPTKVPQYIYFALTDITEIYARAKNLKCLATEIIHGKPAGEIIQRPWGEISFYAYDPFDNGLCFVDEKTVFIGR